VCTISHFVDFPTAFRNELEGFSNAHGSEFWNEQMLSCAHLQLPPLTY
jgi:hypothetical protein